MRNWVRQGATVLTMVMVSAALTSLGLTSAGLTSAGVSAASPEEPVTVAVEKAATVPMVKEAEWAWGGKTDDASGVTTSGNQVFVVGEEWKLRRYTRKGKRTGSWDLNFWPVAIATAPNGQLHVTQQWTPQNNAEDGGTYVHVLNRNGKHLRKYTLGQGVTWFPGDIALDGVGNSYVTDTHDGTAGVHKFDRNGEWQGTLQQAGPDLPLDEVHGVATTRAGVLYLADAGNDRIIRWENGKKAISWGQSGLRNGRFMTPVDVAVTARGTVLVIDLHSRRLQEFGAKGKFLRQVGSNHLNRNNYVHSDASGRFYVTGYHASLVRGVVAFKPKPKPQINVLAKPVRVKAGQVRVRVRCTPGKQCRGNAQVKRGKTVLAQGSYKVKAGKKTVLRLKLTKAGKKAARKKPIKVKVILKTKSGPNVTVNRTFRR